MFIDVFDVVAAEVRRVLFLYVGLRRTVDEVRPNQNIIILDAQRIIQALVNLRSLAGLRVADTVLVGLPWCVVVLVVPAVELRTTLPRASSASEVPMLWVETATELIVVAISAWVAALVAALLAAPATILLL